MNKPVQSIEPDVENFEYLGLACRIQRMKKSGHLCGYVQIPRCSPKHPWHGRKFMLDDRVDVHGGITFSASAPEDWPGGSSSWWIGFDCNHPELGDVAPGKLEPHLEFMNQITGMMQSIVGHQQEWKGTSYRNFEYVKAETKKLAKLVLDEQNKKKGT